MVLSFFTYIILEKITINRENELKNILPNVANTINKTNDKIVAKVTNTGKKISNKDNVTQQEDTMDQKVLDKESDSKLDNPTKILVDGDVRAEEKVDRVVLDKNETSSQLLTKPISNEDVQIDEAPPSDNLNKTSENN